VQDAATTSSLGPETGGTCSAAAVSGALQLDHSSSGRTRGVKDSNDDTLASYKSPARHFTYM
jgi:hypothetical protein